jgi:hypothetical protein
MHNSGAEIRDPRGPLGTLLRVAALGSIGISLWLVFVLAFVLPRTRPDQIPFWSMVAVGFAAFGALSWIFERGVRHALLLGALALCAVAAVGLSAFAVATQITRAAQAREFEGYIVLMGVCLAAHGMILLAYMFTTRSAWRRA